MYITHKYMYITHKYMIGHFPVCTGTLIESGEIYDRKKMNLVIYLCYYIIIINTLMK